jgi:hypothetical protein
MIITATNTPPHLLCRSLRLSAAKKRRRRRVKRMGMEIIMRDVHFSFVRAEIIRTVGKMIITFFKRKMGIAPKEVGMRSL